MVTEHEKETIKRLRKAADEYFDARQERYNQLATWDPYAEDALEKHYEVVLRIDQEQQVPIAGEDTMMGIVTMCSTAYLHPETFELIKCE